MARKRMILSLDEELHSILMEFSKETGTPAASFVVEMLEEMKPRVIKLTQMVKLAKENAIGDAHDLLTTMATEAQLEIKDLKKEVSKVKPSKDKIGSKKE